MSEENILRQRWEQRYEMQSPEIKKKLDELDEMTVEEFQLLPIKRKRIKPQKGDVFVVSPNENEYFYGIVLNDSICNINGDDLLVVVVFMEKQYSIEEPIKQLDYEKLLLRPCIVGREYWTRGYFFNISVKQEIPANLDYGFYSIGKCLFLDEYGKELQHEPKLLGVFGVYTIWGVSREIRKEIIMGNFT